MRREIDELFGDVFERTGLAPRRGFSPSVDVYYVDDPPRAVVKAELAGVAVEDVALEIRGRQLVMAGERRPDEATGRLYQQIEIEHGPFRRVVELGGNRMLAMVAQRRPEEENPGPDDLYRVGVAGVVARMLKVPDGTLRILVHGAQRVRIVDFIATDPYFVARIEEAPDELVPSPELEALHRNVQATFSRIIQEVPYLPEELQIAVTNLDDPSELAHMIGGALRIKTEEKQRLLEEVNVTQRLRLLSEILARELELVEIGTKIQPQVQSEMEKGQREYFLRQQLKAIQEEL